MSKDKTNLHLHLHLQFTFTKAKANLGIIKFISLSTFYLYYIVRVHLP